MSDFAENRSYNVKKVVHLKARNINAKSTFLDFVRLVRPKNIHIHFYKRVYMTRISHTLLARIENLKIGSTVVHLIKTST